MKNTRILKDYLGLKKIDSILYETLKIQLCTLAFCITLRCNQSVELYNIHHQITNT